MQCELMEKFLLMSTIPKVKDSSDRLWDAVHRAHRDVLTGRFYLEKYCSHKDEDINLVMKYLYEIIKDNKDNYLELSSKNLIEKLKSKFEEVEPGAIQKLVNMTLKYILLLFEYEYNEACSVYVDAINCDCPLDSVILSKITKYKNVRWTKITWPQYEEIQAEIHNLLSADGYEKCGNIEYDFLHWAE